MLVCLSHHLIRGIPLRRLDGSIQDRSQGLGMETQTIETAGSILVQEPDEYCRVERREDNVGVVRVKEGREKMDGGKKNLGPEDALEKHRDRGYLLLPVLVEVPDVSHHLQGADIVRAGSRRTTNPVRRTA